MTEEQKSIHWLSSILDVLRKECPWDSVQTIDSLRYLTIEEVHELSEAIVAGNYDEMRKELGDLFMHLMFYSKIAEDEGRFGVADVLDGICTKLIARHPHISLPDKAGNMQPVTQHDTPRWEQVKMKEGRKSVLEGVPQSLPPIVKAIRMQEKAAGVGFEFPDVEGAKNKVLEEYHEFEEALVEMHEESKGQETVANPHGISPKSRAEEELGDLLFAIVKWARMEGLNADTAMVRANQKFFKRFSYVEDQSRLSGRSLSEMTLEEMEKLWNEAKTK